MCPASDLSALGAAVKGYRIQYGLTQAALLEGSNIPLSFLRNLEQGRKRFVTADDIWALAAVLGWPEDELWELIPAGRTSPLFFPLYPQDA